MSDAFSPSNLIVTPEMTPPRRGHPWLAWMLILGVAAVIVLRVFFVAAKAPSGIKDRLQEGIFHVQLRFLIVQSQLSGTGPQQVYDQAKALKRDLPEQGLEFAILAGELIGPVEALRQLRQWRRELDQDQRIPTDKELNLHELLTRLYHDYAQGNLNAPSVAPDERERLHMELGWLGDLALSPAGGPNQQIRQQVIRDAQVTFGFMVAGLFLMGIFFFLGCIMLLIVSVLFFAGRMRSGLGSVSLHGSIYAETFAFWIALYVALSMLFGLLGERLSFDGTDLTIAGLAMIVSLAALVWPVLRGIPWNQVRKDIGWTTGRQPALEPILGVSGYAMCLPLLGIGVILMLILALSVSGLMKESANIQSHRIEPHPVIELLAQPGWGPRIQVFLLACMIAPLVEETMFRGLLYRHLREATVCWQRPASFLVSTGVSSFLFAAVHPTGLLTVPPLMALASGFCLLREWRGTVLPGMIAHGIHNGLIMLLTLQILAS